MAIAINKPMGFVSIIMFVFLNIKLKNSFHNK